MKEIHLLSTCRGSFQSGAVAEWLRHRSREQKVPSSILQCCGDLLMLISIGLYMFNVVCAVRLAVCRVALISYRCSLVHCACM